MQRAVNGIAVVADSRQVPVLQTLPTSWGARDEEGPVPEDVALAAHRLEPLKQTEHAPERSKHPVAARSNAARGRHRKAAVRQA